jgi:HEPN domain-containing protein
MSGGISVKTRKTVAVGAKSSRLYRLRAQEFLATAEDAVARECWSAAALMAVHVGVSAADAVLAARASLRSREDDHEAVVGLLESHVDTFDAAARRQLIGLLKSKNSVEYYDQVVTPTEAKQLVDQARRFLKWAEKAMAV